jgi:hypothetical protein
LVSSSWLGCCDDILKEFQSVGLDLDSIKTHDTADRELFLARCWFWLAFVVAAANYASAH